jgi:hypothetical protein
MKIFVIRCFNLSSICNKPIVKCFNFVCCVKKTHFDFDEKTQYKTHMLKIIQ